MTPTYTDYKWVRAKDGVIAGVCKGIAQNLNINPWVLRISLLIAILFFGTGLLIYFVLAICLPREDKIAQANQNMILGVCARIAQQTHVEVGIVRVMAAFLMCISLGSTIVGYIILHFVLPHPNAKENRI